MSDGWDLACQRLGEVLRLEKDFQSTRRFAKAWKRAAKSRHMKAKNAAFAIQFAAEDLRRLRAENAALKAKIEAADKIIALGVKLMPLNQLSKWEGVRGWQESELEHFGEGGK